MPVTRRPAVPALAIALCALGAPAAHGAAPPALGAVTVVSGSRSAYADVRLPRTAQLGTLAGGAPDITVSGGARLTAIVLVGRSGGARGVTLAGGAFAAGGQVERFALPVPQWPTHAGTSYDGATHPNPVVLPAGTYRLYFVSTAPATVTVRLRGLSGRRVVTPRRAAVGSVVPGDQHVTDSGNPVRNNVFAASSTKKLARRGFALQVLQSRLDAAAAWQIETCMRPPATSPLPTDAPPCPGDMGVIQTGVNDRVPALADTKLFVRGFAGLAPGEHRVGARYVAPSVASATAYAAMWLEY